MDCGSLTEASVGNYSQLQGYPALFASPPYNLKVLASVDPENPAVLRALADDTAVRNGSGLLGTTTTIAVDWGSDGRGMEAAGGHAELTVLLLPGPSTLARTSTDVGAPLSLSFEAEPSGAAFLARLVVTGTDGRTVTCTRHLHLHAPPSRRNTTHMALTASPDNEPPLPGAVAREAWQCLRSPPSPLTIPLTVTRGVGLELELLGLDPSRHGHATMRGWLHAVLDAIEAEGAAAITTGDGASSRGGMSEARSHHVEKGEPTTAALLRAADSPSTTTHPSEEGPDRGYLPICCCGQTCCSQSCFTSEQQHRQPPAAMHPPEEEWSALCDRLRLWAVTNDHAITPFTPYAANSLAAELGLGPAAADAMSRSRGLVGIELKSPPPPNELRLGGIQEHQQKQRVPRDEDDDDDDDDDDDGDGAPDRGIDGSTLQRQQRPRPVAEIRLLFKLLHSIGFAAPDTGEKGTAAMLHCHVNVTNPEGAGRLLWHREILSVWQAWVKYDLVTTKLARSWLWRDRWAAPLYATGAEFTFDQKPWEQGRVKGLAELRANDVPVFVRRCHAAVRSRGFRECEDERGRLQVLFAPTLTPGKHVSLNLEHVTTFGTLEFRRMHATTDPDWVLCWSHFCAAFVEKFSRDRDGENGGERTGGGCLRHFLDAPDADTALRELEAAQASATQEMLEAEMGLPEGHLARMISYGSCG